MVYKGILTRTRIVFIDPLRKGVFIGLSKKVNVTLYLDDELVNKARLIGFNLSRLMENALRETLGKMDFPCGHTWSSGNSPNNEKPQNELILPKNLVGRERLELSTFCVSGRCPNQARRPAQSQLVEVRQC